MIALVPFLPAISLPRKNEDLAHEWGLDGSWDFLYVPMYSGGKRALGYAFINFVSEAASAAFYSQWQGRYLPKFQRGRPLNIVVAEMQGFSANLTHVKQKSAGRLRSWIAGVHGSVGGYPWTAAPGRRKGGSILAGREPGLSPLTYFEGSSRKPALLR